MATKAGFDFVQKSASACITNLASYSGGDIGYAQNACKSLNNFGKAGSALSVYGQGLAVVTCIAWLGFQAYKRYVVVSKEEYAKLKKEKKAEGQDAV